MSHYLNQKILGFFVKTNGILSRPLFSGIGHILCFHRVMPGVSTERIERNSGMEVSPEFIETIIEFFEKKNYEFISLDQLYSILVAGEKTKKKFIVFTMDDGYSDNYYFAYPVFKKHNIPFAIYVATDFPDHKAVLWWYMLEDLLLKTPRVEFIFKGENYLYKCETKEQKEESFLNIRNLILERDSEKEELFQMIFSHYEIQKMAMVEKNALNWEQIIELSEDGLVTIGAHTITHRPLNKLSEAEAKQEIEQSRKLIEEKIDKKVKHFAYPFGGIDTCGEREFSLVKQAGFKTATTLRQGNIFSRYKDYMERIPRIPLGEKSDLERLMQISNGIHHFGNNYFKRTIID